MPSNTMPRKEEKIDNHKLLVDLIQKQYGTHAAMAMDESFKEEKKQIKDFHAQGGTSNDLAKTIGVDIDMIEKLIQSGGTQQELPQKSTPTEQTPMQPSPELLQPKGLFTTQSMTPEGNIQLGGKLAMGGMSLENMKILQELMGKTPNQQAITPESQVATIQKTQNLLKQLGIEATVGATATGAPTISVQPGTGLSELPEEQQLAAYDLARKIGGVRGATKVLPAVIAGLKAGKNPDQLEDELRMKKQSTEFSDDWRGAAQNIYVGKTESQRNLAFDALDDLVEKGDTEGAKDYLKRMAITSAPADQQNRVMGKERTVQLLDEIQSDLDTLEQNGINTGFFSGNWEKLLGRVGQVKEPKLRETATRVAVAMMNYRRDMTGVQFGEREGKEYKTLFPNIDKVGIFNKSTISGLRRTFSGDLDKFYSLSMGDKNYKKLFGGKTQTSSKQTNTQNIPKKIGRFTIEVE